MSTSQLYQGYEPLAPFPSAAPTNLDGAQHASWRGLVSSNNRTPILIAGFASLGGLCFGYDQGVIANVLVMDDYMQRFALSSVQLGFVTAALELGCVIGSLQASFWADAMSRRYSLVLASSVFLVGSLLQTFCFSFGSLTAGRAIGGLGIGAMSMLSPLYMSEISPAELRGAILALEQLSIVSGVVLGFWFGFATRNLPGSISWRLPLFVQILPAILLILALLFIFPFSPRWLASQSSPKSQALGLESLARLRQRPANDSEVQREWREILVEARFAQECREERIKGFHPSSGSRWMTLKAEVAEWKSLLDPGLRRRTIVGCGVMLFQQLSGINALLYYGPTMLASLGLSGSLPTLLGSGLINIIQLVVTFPAILWIDSLGRKRLLTLGALGMMFALLGVAGIVACFDGEWEQHQTMAWTAVGFIYAFTASYGLSFGPIAWVLPSEVFPTSVSARGVALSTASNWTFNALIGLVTPPLLSFSPLLTYCLFAGSCFGGYLFASLIVPETKGRGLEEMDEVFGDGKLGSEDRDRKRRIRAELEREEGQTIAHDA